MNDQDLGEAMKEFHGFVENLFISYSWDPIKRAARLTIFQIFFRPIPFNRACSLNIWTKSFTLNTNQLSKYECFFQH